MTWRNTVRKVYHDPETRFLDSSHIQQEGCWYPLHQFQNVLSPKPDDWQSSEQTPEMVSLFEDMLTLFPLTVRNSTLEPHTYTDICRRLVLSAWTAHLRIIEAQVAQKRTEMSMGDDLAAKKTSKIFILPWARPWRPEDFNRLVRASAVLQSIDTELRSNLDALGVDTSEAQILDPWEVTAWKNLREVIQLQKFRVDSILETYMQAISVRQSINAGYLTSMATIFIPVSLVAAVFSMNGEYAAGESLFWVFWVMAIPVTLLGCFLLFTKIGVRLFEQPSAEISAV